MDMSFSVNLDSNSDKQKTLVMFHQRKLTKSLSICHLSSPHFGPVMQSFDILFHVTVTVNSGVTGGLIRHDVYVASL